MVIFLNVIICFYYILTEQVDHTGLVPIFNEKNGFKGNIYASDKTIEITNIDKVLPEIKEITEENITTKSIDIKVKGQDNESGLSEIRIYKNEEK